MPHLYTLTGNLLAERTLEFDGWAPGRTQRAAGESFQVGGKGINVSKMLNRLGAANTALCFTGGAPGAECEAWLRARGFDFRAFPASRATRSGTVIRDRRGALAETTLLGPDAAPDAPAVRACAEFLETQPDGQVLAVCGSIPGWSTDAFDPLRRALVRWSERGLLVADTYGAPLPWFAGLAGGALIKINADEFRGFAQAEPGTLGTGASRWPHTRWIVTDGAREVWLADAGQRAQSLRPPAIQEISATGSGDVLLACVLHALFNQRLSLSAAVTFALPYAAANAAHPGIAEF